VSISIAHRVFSWQSRAAMARPKKQETTASSSNSTPSSNAPSPHSPPNAAAEAFAKVEPELAALAPEEIAPVTVEIPAAVTAVLAAVPRIREHREAVVEQLPKHPVELLDNLETYAQAAWYAHLAHTYAHTSPESAKALIDEAQKLRDGLLIAAEALAHRGLLDADTVARIRKGQSHADTAGDLIALGALFHSGWGKVNSKTAVERHEVDRAAELGPAVMVAIAMRKHAGKPGDSEGQRARAFTLLSRAYDACRRALAYLRWSEGDADAIAPSLYKKKPGRKPGSSAKHEEAEVGESAPNGAAEAEAG
jgi:hypothetical protein